MSDEGTCRIVEQLDAARHRVCQGLEMMETTRQSPRLRPIGVAVGHLLLLALGLCAVLWPTEGTTAASPSLAPRALTAAPASAPPRAKSFPAYGHALATGPRLARLELAQLIYKVAVTDNHQAAAEQIAAAQGLTAAQVLASPYYLIGTVDELAETLLARRERHGISYISVFPADVAAFAPVVARLAGN